MKKRSLTAFLLIISCVISLLAGCGGSKQEPAQTAASSAGGYKDTLTVAVEIDQQLNPWLNTSTNGQIAAWQIFDALVKVDEDGSIVPSLAASWEQTDDTHYTLKLRENVTFHDGTPFTAKDVMFFFENLDSLSTMASRYAYVDVANCRAVDDYTFELALKSSYAEAIEQLAWGMILPKDTMEKVGVDEFMNAPVGTGPYKFVEWSTGVGGRLQSYDGYWGEDKAKTEFIDIRVIPDASNRVVELETGSVDLAFTPGPANVARIDSTDGIHTEMGASARYILLTFSMQDELLSNKDVRYALTYAIDRQALSDSCYNGTAYTMGTMWPDMLFGAKDFGADAFPYDLEKAKELMKKAGYEDGFEIDLQVVGDEEKMVCEAIQNMWSKLNVRTNIIQMGWANYEAAGNRYQAAVRSGAATNLTNAIIIYKSSFGRTLQVNDEWLDTAVQKSDTIMNPEERQAVLNEIQDYLYDVRYSMPIVNCSMIYAMSDKVEGFKFAKIGLPYLQSAAVAE